MMKNIILDYRTNKESISMLARMGYNIIKTTPVRSLYEAVSGHPDMQLHFMGDNKVVCAKEVYSYYKEKLPDRYNLICGSQSLQDTYPYDILYNAAVIGDFVVCNEKYTSKEILEEYSRIGKKILNVKQGYAKCSIAVISDKAAITADEGIYKTLMKNRINTLKIEPGYVRLKTLPYGFIGGCSGLLRKGLLAVNGNIDKHPEGSLIRGFCRRNGTEILCLNKEELYDIGSMIVI